MCNYNDLIDGILLKIAQDDLMTKRDIKVFLSWLADNNGFGVSNKLLSIRTKIEEQDVWCSISKLVRLGYLESYTTKGEITFYKIPKTLLEDITVRTQKHIEMEQKINKKLIDETQKKNFTEVSFTEYFKNGNCLQ